MSNMPKLPFDAMCEGVDEESARMIRAACNNRTGCLRTSKPFRHIDFHGDKGKALFRACANYVWRMLCFHYVGHRPHSCMPCTADYDIGTIYHFREERGDYADRNERYTVERVLLDALDVMIKQAEAVMPITAQKGAMQRAGLTGLYKL